MPRLPGGLIDSLEPVVSFGSGASASRRAITLSVLCPGKHCTLDATGSIVVGGQTSSAKALTARRLSLTNAVPDGPSAAFRAAEGPNGNQAK